MLNGGFRGFTMNFEAFQKITGSSGSQILMRIFWGFQRHFKAFQDVSEGFKRGFRRFHSLSGECLWSFMGVSERFQ